VLAPAQRPRENALPPLAALQTTLVDIILPTSCCRILLCYWWATYCILKRNQPKYQPLLVPDSQ
jgi:hypothetical protein